MCVGNVVSTEVNTMGFFRSIAVGMLDMASRGRNNTMLALIFQDNPKFAGLALNIFQRCLAERRLQLTEIILIEARREVSKYPSLTMGEFLDAKGNLNMGEALHGR